MAFSPDGTCVLTSSDDKTARLWDAHTGAALGEPFRHDDRMGGAGGVRSIAFSPDGARLVTDSFDNTARLWDARPAWLDSTNDENRALVAQLYTGQTIEANGKLRNLSGEEWYNVWNALKTRVASHGLDRSSVLPGGIRSFLVGH